MPYEIIIFKDEKGRIPLLEWLDSLDDKVSLKITTEVKLLRAFGHELRRPHADYLGHGIYELRTRVGNVNYRVLYFFQKNSIIVLSHGFSKEKKIPVVETQRALYNKTLYEANPDKHGTVTKTW